MQHDSASFFDAEPAWEPDVDFIPLHPKNGPRSAAVGLPVRFWSDLGDVVPPDRLVRRLFGETSLSTVYGEPACGKTFFVTDMGLHIALGRPWFGRPVAQGSVLYIAGEGLAGINNRLAGFRQRHDLSQDVPFAIVPLAIDLGPEGRDAARVIEAAATIEKRSGEALKLVIIDTLARNMGSGDENTSRDMGAFVTACDRIRTETGAAVIIVHHSGKSQQAGARGSSALLAAVDTAVMIERRDDARVATVVKQKDGSDGEELCFNLEVVEIGRDDDEAITTCIVKPSGEVAKRAPKLSPTERRSIDVLLNTLIDHPVSRENYRDSLGNSVTLPNVTLTKIDTFRAALKSAGVTDRDSPQNERQQWRRITTSLANKGVFVMRGDLCWKA